MQFFSQGGFFFKPEIKQTKNGRDWCRILVEFTSARETRPGEFVSETTVVPVNCFAACAERVKGLKVGDHLTVGCRVTGTKFRADDGDRYGVQLVAEQVFVAAVAREVST
jgi:hypothetical protein